MYLNRRKVLFLIQVFNEKLQNKQRFATWTKYVIQFSMIILPDFLKIESTKILIVLILSGFFFHSR